MTAAPAGGGLAEVLGLVAEMSPGPLERGKGVAYEPDTYIYCDDSFGSAIANCVSHTVAVSREQQRKNAAGFVAAVNYLRSHGEAIRELVAKSEKVASWLDLLARQAERHAQDTRFQSLADAAAADAKNFRETADDIRRSLLPFTTGEQG